MRRSCSPDRPGQRLAEAAPAQSEAAAAAASRPGRGHDGCAVRAGSAGRHLGEGHSKNRGEWLPSATERG